VGNRRRETHFADGIAQAFGGINERLAHRQVLMPRVIVFAGALKLSQRALQVLNLAFVVGLLAFRQFQRFQHLFHLFERMFQFLDDAVDLLDGVGNRGLLVLLLGWLGPGAPLDVFPALGAFNTVTAFSAVTALNTVGAFITFRAFSALGLLHLFRVFTVFLGGMLHRVRRGFRCGIAVLGFRFSRCGSIAGRGQGTAVIAAPGMAATATAGPTPATRDCRIRLWG